MFEIQRVRKQPSSATDHVKKKGNVITVSSCHGTVVLQNLLCRVVVLARDTAVDLKIVIVCLKHMDVLY